MEENVIRIRDKELFEANDKDLLIYQSTNDRIIGH